MTTKKLTPQMPGEAVKPEVQADEETVDQSGEGGAEAQGDQSAQAASQEPSTETDSDDASGNEIEQERIKLAQERAQFEADKERWAQEQQRVAAKRPTAKASATVAGGLPDQSQVDARKIQRSVLTKQGWVVPIKDEPKRML